MTATRCFAPADASAEAKRVSPRGDVYQKYSSLDQINTENVSKLKVAWAYRSGDAA